MGRDHWKTFISDGLRNPQVQIYFRCYFISNSAAEIPRFLRVAALREHSIPISQWEKPLHFYLHVSKRQAFIKMGDWATFCCFSTKVAICSHQSANHLVFQEPWYFDKFSPEGFWKRHLAEEPPLWLSEWLDTTGLFLAQVTRFSLFSSFLVHFLAHSCPTRHTL